MSPEYEQSSLGPLLPHTEAKHDILRYHLRAWFPILGRSFSRLQYIDGFAGPGEYEGGEPGSPIIALREVATHSYLPRFVSARKRIDFLFVDNNPAHMRHLRGKVAETRSPDAFGIDTQDGDFESVLRTLLDDVEAGRRQMSPTLAFVDPFGSSGFSMELMAQLAAFRGVDVLINLNHVDFVHWILPDSSKHGVADSLYGSGRWRPALCMSGRERASFLVTEYEDALREVGWRGANFEMVNMNNQTQYYLVFGTGHPKGMEVMKRAMRRVSRDGLFRYSDRTDPAQLRLMGMGAEEEYPRDIADHLFAKYHAQEVPKETIIENHVVWHPRWMDVDLTGALKLLEYSSPPRILGVRNSDGRRRRKGDYPAGCLITFGSQALF